MKNFVISLTTATARRQHIQKQFSTQNIPFEFFDAITPEPAQRLVEQLELPIRLDLLTSGELACFMSHVVIWKKVVDEKIDHVAVFEDDAIISQAAASYLFDDSWVPENCHLIKIEAFKPRVYMSYKKEYSLEGDRKLSILLEDHLATAGYILTLEGAHSLLNYVLSNQSTKPVDHIMFVHYVKQGQHPVFQMHPALCVQDDILNKHQPCLPSMLEQDRSQRHLLEKMIEENAKRSDPNYRHTLSPIQKLKRELMRPFLQFLRAMTIRNLLARRVYFK
jgi:glycosyl transferase family 25